MIDFNTIFTYAYNCNNNHICTCIDKQYLGHIPRVGLSITILYD